MNLWNKLKQFFSRNKKPEAIFTMPVPTRPAPPMPTVKPARNVYQKPPAPPPLPATRRIRDDEKPKRTSIQNSPEVYRNDNYVADAIATYAIISAMSSDDTSSSSSSSDSSSSSSDSYSGGGGSFDGGGASGDY